MSESLDNLSIEQMSVQNLIPGEKTASEETQRCDDALLVLDGNKHEWARTDCTVRIFILQEIKTALLQHSEGWAEIAARRKRLPASSTLKGEEWLAGPLPVMATCNGLIETLSKMENKAFLAQLPYRRVAKGQLALKVFPHTLWDKLLLSGVKAEVWMQRGVNEVSIEAASAYDLPAGERSGKLALVLGAGNVAAISPLDALHKLFVENEVVLLKLNPINDYLFDYLHAAFKPLIDRNALRIVRGGNQLGAYLVEHPLVESIHITGAAATHDLIVWGEGKEADNNRKNDKPRNTRRITSELGAVCPTIVVPGSWTKADIRFQAEQIATQKMQNSGYNCVAMQTLIVPEGWEGTEVLLRELKSIMTSHGGREQYYPGSQQRCADFRAHGGIESFDQFGRLTFLVADFDQGESEWLANNEVFAPAFTIKFLSGECPKNYLASAIDFANEKLHGTLGANIVIHPATIKKIGREKFESLLGQLRYGTIAINTWTGLAFLLNACPWGAFPGASLKKPGSGIGTVHNTWMLERTEKTVVQAPWRPFPRNLLSLNFSLLPRPPWFITNGKQHILGRLLTYFYYLPSVWKLPGIFINALKG